MATRNLTLPKFRDPPLIEVALSVRFEPIAKLSNPHIGLLWADFRQQFPVTETHPPLPLTIEQFGGSPKPVFELTVETEAPKLRYWFLNDERSELIQVQADAFVHNWRKADSSGSSLSGPFRHYEQIRHQFSSHLDTFQDFLKREHLGEINPLQCEVTYVNHIEAGKGWNSFKDLADVVSLWVPAEHPDLPEVEDVRLYTRHFIDDESGAHIGRLLIQLEPGFRQLQPVILLKLVARGRPDGEGIPGVAKFLDLGHELIVTSFASITRRNMHEIWGRYQ